MSISRSVVICSFIFFLLSKSYVYSQNLLETATSFLQIARNGESPDACRAALDRIYEELPQTSFEKVTPGDVDTLPNILQMAFFEWSDTAYRWHQAGSLDPTPQNLEMLATANRVILHTLVEALFVRDVIWPMAATGELGSYKGFPKTKSQVVGFVARPYADDVIWGGRVPLNLDRVLNFPHYWSMRGGPNSFFSPFIARQPLDNLRDGVVSHSLLRTTAPEDVQDLLRTPSYQRLYRGLKPGDPIVLESLVEDGVRVRADPNHALALQRTQKKLGIVVGVAPRNLQVAQAGSLELISQALGRDKPMAYNSAMDPNAPDSLYCSQVCWMAESLGRAAVFGVQGYRPFAMTQLDFGNDEAHKKLGIERGVEIYSPGDVLVDPNNDALFILINPVVAHEAQIADDIRDILNEKLAEGWKVNQRNFTTYGMRAVSLVRRQLRDWPPYPGWLWPIADIQERVPRVTDEQAIFFGANQGPHKVLLKEIRQAEISWMQEQASRGQLPMPFTREHRRRLIQKHIEDPSEEVAACLIAP